jgi:hypothetical protein
MIEIVEGLFIFAEKVAAVKAADEKRCVLYLDGIGALDGFVLERPALDVAQEIADAVYGGEDQKEDEDEPDDEHPDAADSL